MKNAWIILFFVLGIVFQTSCRTQQDEVGESIKVVDISTEGQEEVLVSEEHNQEIGSQESDSSTSETDQPGSETPVAVVPDPVDECVVCHADKQSLIDTAKPIEPVESENEGEG